MQPRYLLYVDILGFSDLVDADPGRIDDLYEIIAGLNVHRHDAFKTIVFSDTILVYNRTGDDTPRDAHYLVMFLCEFAKDLFLRLTERDIHFRAVITRGPFRHYELNGVPCFFGSALIHAYRREKHLKAIGLFIDRQLECFCDIFSFTHFDEEFSFVFVTQALDRLEEDSANGLPIDAEHIENTDQIWAVAPELLNLRRLQRACEDARPPDVQRKYATTMGLYKRRYPRVVTYLEAHSWNIVAISPHACWRKVLSRYPESYSFAIRERREF